MRSSERVGSRRTPWLAVLLAGFVVLGLVPSAGAQSTTDVYFVHGVNTEDQSAPGGSPATVCVDGEQLIAEFSFGDISGPYPFETGRKVRIEVYDAHSVDCASPAPAGKVIDVERSPEDKAVTYVATFQGDPPSGGPIASLTPMPVSVDCKSPEEGLLSFYHASADSGPLQWSVDGEPEGDDDFGRTSTVLLEPGTVDVAVADSGTTVVGPTQVEITEQVNTTFYVVGGISDGASATPLVALVDEVDLGVCETEDEQDGPPPTTTPPTTTTVGTVPAARPTSPSTGAAPLAITG